MNIGDKEGIGMEQQHLIVKNMANLVTYNLRVERLFNTFERQYIALQQLTQLMLVRKIQCPLLLPLLVVAILI
jgi:hypothetical protein